MELNGIANALMLLDQLKSDNKDEVVDSQIEAIKEQLELCERYFLAYASARDAKKFAPHWHQVRAEPLKFPTMRERFKDLRKEK